jgi:hypothetical protein
MSRSATHAAISPTFAALLRRARLQALLSAALWVLPAWALLRFGGAGLAPTLWLDGLALCAFAVLVARAVFQRDPGWLAQRLNTRREFEDSAGLLHTEAGGVLAPLQRARLQRRLLPLRLRDVGLSAPRRGQILPALLALAVILLLPLLAQSPTSAPTLPAPTADERVLTGPPQLRSAQIELQPPAYSGQPARSQTSLDIAALAATRAEWRLRIEPAPTAAALVFIDGSRLELAAADQAEFRASMALQTSTRYRLELDGAVQGLDKPAAQIEVSADAPPVIRVRRPGQTLNIVDSATPLELEIEASDDFGLGAAELVLTLAQGDGEMVEVSEQRLALRGEGDARERHYLRRLDLAAMGFAEGNDLILRVEIVDNRAPSPQRSRSPSYILRWPRLRESEGSGVEGFVQRILPAYFRSQRQVIIDTEALIAERSSLEQTLLLSRSDSIGVDQRLLRLRYGEFLGEEVENDGPLLPEGHSLDDGHGHTDPSQFGDAESVIRAYGHNHDQAEATTLFDPVTRERLRVALREMWQSELHLRMGDPVAALPYQFRALALIKQIQQASRIYLARVGLELPPIMLSRRLSGDRSTARGPRDPLQPALRSDAPLRVLWSALAPTAVDATEREAAMGGFEQWLARQPADTTLDLREQLDRLRRAPDCSDCATALREALWPRLQTPPQGPQPRAPIDTAGRAWLQAREGGS